MDTFYSVVGSKHTIAPPRLAVFGGCCDLADRELRDIGITRGEIDYVASNRLCKPDASDRPGLRTGHCDVACWHFSDLTARTGDVRS